MAKKQGSKPSNPNVPMKGPHDRIKNGQPPAPQKQKAPGKQSGVSAPRKR